MTNKNNGLFGHFGDNLNRRGESVDFVKLDKNAINPQAMVW
jgi:hypothetical protein